MTDTPQHIYDIQLKNWLSKTPAERLEQFLTDNDAMRQALKNAKEHLHITDTVTNLPVSRI